jgi:glucuronate isomerase
MSSFLSSKKYLLSSSTARKIFREIEFLPIVDPHNHADARGIAENENYNDPWQLFAATDHYVWEMLRKRNVPEEYITGNAYPKEKWLKMASVFSETAGNPVFEWIHLDLKRYLGIDKLLCPETGLDIWEKASAVLKKKSKKPQALLREMRVETICSTDDPLDDLAYHENINKIFGGNFIRPTWRPDKIMNITANGWSDYVENLEKKFNTKINSLSDLLDVLRISHDYFADHGCVASDHGVEQPPSGIGKKGDAETAFKKARKKIALPPAEAKAYTDWIFGELAELDAEKDWVFQIHIGAVRNVRNSLFSSLGPDSGGDVSDHFIDILTPLRCFLNRFDSRLKLVLYCLDPFHQATLATLARAFGSNVRLGSAWWLCDNPIGMRRQLEYIGSVDLFANFAGMVSDSRKLLSFGSRFEMFRRVLSDVLGTMVNLGQMPEKTAIMLAEKMAYSEPKKFFRI